MIGKIIHFIKRKDWRGFSILKKAGILGLYALKPLYTWKRYPELTLQALELDRNDLCINHGQINNIFDIKYGNGTKVLMTLREMINIYRLVDKTLELPGDLAEVGVYQGGSAKIICEAKGNKPLHLFDTFEGLPSPDETIDKLVKGDMHNTSLELVKHNLNGYEDVNFYKGYFPDTAGPVKDKSFSFVNLDTDIYESTKSCLEFFYPRMEKQGVLLTHDYNDTRTPGVKKAFDEYFGSKPEYVIELWDTQAMIIKN
jgi:O-methyltransferase